MAARLDLPTPKPFKVLGEQTNLSRSWENYVKRFEYYISASGVTKDEQRKALLLHLCGEEIQDIFETFVDPGNSYKDTVEKLTEYFNPKKNIAYERHIFRQAQQEHEETIDNFVIRLKKLSVSCEYPDGSVNDMIRDQVVEKCNSKELKKKLLREQDLNLDKIQAIARTSELADLHVSKMDDTQKNGTSHQKYGVDEDVQQLRGRPNGRKPRKQFYPRTRPRTAPKPTQLKSCYRCGGKSHSGHECIKSRNIICRDCNRRGHYAHMCRTQNKKQVSHISNQDFEYDSSSSDTDFVFQMTSKETSPFIKAEVQGKQIKLLIDSGATVNCIDKATFETFNSQNISLRKSKAKIYPYASKVPLRILGIAELNVKINENKHQIKFHVVNSKCTPLIGQQCAVNLGLLKICVNTINHENMNSNVKDTLLEYADRFEGLGKLKDFELKLNINKDVTPVVQPNRRIPFKMRKQVDNKIQQLLEMDVIEKTQGPTPWISPIVVIPKTNDIRLCIDLRQANTAVERERFPLPNIDETLEELNGSKYFSKLDLKMGFHKISL